MVLKNPGTVPEDCANKVDKDWVVRKEKDGLSTVSEDPAMGRPSSGKKLR